MTPPGYEKKTSTPWSSSASHSTSAPIRVRLRSRPSWSIPFRARSIAAASAVPSFGTWLRLVAGSPLAIVIGMVPPASRKNESPAPTRRGCGRLSVVVALVALVPPCPSVPPGAGNKPKKATKPRKGKKQVEERYVGGIEGNVHAAAIRRDDDGDLAAIP